jgi:hypothetical protein
MISVWNWDLLNGFVMTPSKENRRCAAESRDFYRPPFAAALPFISITAELEGRKDLKGPQNAAVSAAVWPRVQKNTMWG